MANDINSVVLIGRLVRESDLKYTNSGTAVCKFSIAVNRRKKTGDKWEDEVSFIDCVLWGKTAEALHPYLEKGKQISVSGELRQNRWTKDGVNRSKLEVNINTVELLGGGDPKENKTPPDYHVMPKEVIYSNQKSITQSSGPEEFDDEDIPF